MGITCPLQQLLNLKTSELLQDSFPRLLYTVSQCPGDGTPAFVVCAAVLQTHQRLPEEENPIMGCLFGSAGEGSGHVCRV